MPQQKYMRLLKHFRANSLDKYTKHLQYTLLNVKSRQTAIYIDMSLRYFVQKRSSIFFLVQTDANEMFLKVLIKIKRES